MDAVQITIIAISFILTMLMVALGVQVWYILKEIRISIEKMNKIGDLFVDSLFDIAVNKIFTIYQKPRSRDFIDLYLILQTKKWSMADLVKKAKIKFDWHVDPLQLASQFLQATEVKDCPKMIKKIKPEVWQNFFKEEAKKFKEQVVT